MTAEAAFVIAHRGASYDCPENTEAAVRRALELGCTAIECDVQLSKDGAPLVFHDEDLRRLCGSPERVDERNAAEVVGRAVLEKEKPTHHAVVLTLNEWLALLPAHVHAVIELKEQRTGQANEELASAALRCLHDHRGRVSMISFATSLLQSIGRQQPDLARGLIENRPYTQQREQQLLAEAQPIVVLKKTLLDPERTPLLRQRGCELWSYALDEAEEVQRALSLGVGGIISNRPDVALQQLS